MQFSRVIAPFRANKSNELSIDTNDIVIIRTENIHGWCFAEALDGTRGYIPFAYVSPFVPTEPYVGEWERLEIMESANHTPVRSIRRDLVITQRRSLMKSQSMHSSYRSG